MIGPRACSSLAAAEPLAGSAPLARAWLVVEHPGPWGRDALTDSAIDPEVVAHIDRAQERSGLRFLAARAIGHDRRHDGGEATRRVWMVHCDPDGGSGRTTVIEDWRAILEWDLQSWSDGLLPMVGDPMTDSVEFVCTHSKRDTCCAVLGRELIATVPTHLHSRVWECSHLGGHRFAATSVFLPSGRVYGRLPSTGSWQGAALEEPTPDHLRGPSYSPAVLQTAECAVRIDARLSATHSVYVQQRAATAHEVIVDARDGSGRRWTVICHAQEVDSPASCGAASTRRVVWHPRIVEAES